MAVSNQSLNGNWADLVKGPSRNAIRTTAVPHGPKRAGQVGPVY